MVKRGRVQMTIWRMRHIVICTHIHTHLEYVILLFHGNNGNANAPQRYVIQTLPVLCS